MKALRTKICTYAIALLASISFASPALAGSSDFSGVFIAGHAEMNVIAIDGTHTATEVLQQVEMDQKTWKLLQVLSVDLLLLLDGK